MALTSAATLLQWNTHKSRLRFHTGRFNYVVTYVRRISVDRNAHGRSGLGDLPPALGHEALVPPM